jgi:Flp pilus assembly protein protease CpaA
MALVVLYTDYKFGLIHNRVVYPAMLCGFAIAGLQAWAASSGPQSGWWWLPLMNSLGTAFLFFLVMLGIFVMGGVGGGDVKLVTAGAAMLGFPMILEVLMYACLVGLAMGLSAVIWQGKALEFAKRLVNFRQLFRRQKLEDSVQLVRFGVAYAGGTLWAYALLFFRG